MTSLSRMATGLQIKRCTDERDSYALGFKVKGLLL